jgi:glycosyltransferase involved in cell wall biosynthesis
MDKVQNINLGYIEKEIIIVNDSSKDKTENIIEKLKKKYKNIVSFTHKRNKGKGAAIRTALKHFSGDILVIQDGDLEYNPVSNGGWHYSYI